MPDADRMYWLYALTPVHVGMGRGEGYIDLPLMRERVSGYPVIPGSSVKGVVADSCGATAEARTPNGPDYRPEIQAAFGRAGDDLANAGALSFSDARLICLAARSLYGTFAWVSCPFVLARLKRDLHAAGLGDTPQVPVLGDTDACVPELPAADAANPSALCKQDQGVWKTFLEDLDLWTMANDHAGSWAATISTAVFTDPEWQTAFKRRFLVVSDDIFGFLVSTATEVQPHIRMEPDRKIVDTGALWYEESLPAESILAGVVWCDPVAAAGPTREQIGNLLCDRSVQLGGKATTGKGRVRMLFGPVPAIPVAP